MQFIDVCKKSSGRLWHRKLTADPETGCYLNITNSVPSIAFKPGRNIRFVRSAFDSSASGDTFVAGDHYGNLFYFDLHKNRFSLIQKCGLPCTALAFNLHQSNEVLVALADYSLRCYNTESKELVSTLKGHSSAIHQLSVHGSGRCAISSSHDTSILWDLDTFTRKRTLNGAQAVGVQQVFFLPSSNTLISCFKDDSIFAWECDTMKCLYQLNSPSGQKPEYRCLATTRDSRILVASGRSRFLHVWNLDSQHLIRIIQLPAKIKDVRQIEFVNDSVNADQQQTLALLSQDGILRFIDVNACKLLFEVGSSDQRITHFALSPNGRYLTGIIDNGSLGVFGLEAMFGSGKRVPCPLVQTVKTDLSKTSKRSKIDHNDKTGAFQTHEKVNKDGLLWKAEEKTESFHRELPDGLDMKRLLEILKGFGEYPAKYRLFIWRSLLRLPENHVAFSVLIDKGTHNAYARVHEQYPIKSRRLLRVLERVLSAMAYWSPIFGETDWLPMLAFPFVKLFPNNQLICFEVIATILTNWCQRWFEFFPNPPLTILGMVETILSHHDKHLIEHFVKYDITTQIYAWPLLQTLLSEILTKEDWLRLWDNVLSNHPSFLLFAIVAYIICSRQTLLSTTDQEDVKFFFHHRNPIDLSSVVKEAYRLDESTPADIHPKRILQDFLPLTKGQYPIFDKYPKFVVDYLIQEREKMRQDELEYLRQKQMTLYIRKESEKTREEEAAFYRQQELMVQAEKQRRDLIMNEEQRLTDQRTRLQALKREVSLRELRLLDGVRRKFLHHQGQVKEMELQRLDDELQKKINLREQETGAAIDDAEIKSLELEAQKRLFQQELSRDAAESTLRYKTDLGLNEKKDELEEAQIRRLIGGGHEINGEQLKVLNTEMAQVQQQSSDVDMQREVGIRRNIQDIDRQIRSLEISKRQLENESQEKELHNVIQSVINKERIQTTKELIDLKQSRREEEVHNYEDVSSLELEETSLKDFSLSNRRGAFEDKQLDLLAQIQDLRRKVAHRTKHNSYQQTFSN